MKIWDEDQELIKIRNQKGKILKDDVQSNRDLIPRLTYWELMGLSIALPDIFAPTYFSRESLNERQKNELEAFHNSIPIQWPKDKQPGLIPYNVNDFDYSLRYRTPPVSPDVINILLKGVSSTNVSGTEEKAKEELSAEKSESEEIVVAFQEEIHETVQKKPAEPEIPAGTQEDFITSPLDESHLIFAPPGTGKTHALIERIKHILKSANLEEPANEVVVLSFSRAAVREVRKRVTDAVGSGAGGDFEYITVRTFDSFTTNVMLLDLDYEKIKEGLSYGEDSSFDRRIRKFNAGLESEQLKKGIKHLDKIRYLFVDEVQDLCGVRADMVSLLVNRVAANGMSVSLLGDPAQGIYDWQAKKSGATTSRQFIAEIKTQYDKFFHKIRFGEYFRYENGDMKKFAEDVSLAVGDGSQPDTDRLQRLAAEQCESIESVGISKLFLELGSLTILTRNNLETWQLADYCRGSNIPFEIHRGAGGRRWPEWLGRMFFGFESDNMGESKFQQRWNLLIGDTCGIEIEKAWSLLEAEGLARNETVNISRINKRISTEEIPESWLSDSTEQEKVLISTIHKSKGMEFPHVLVLESEPDAIMQHSEEARIFYVAVTRAKESLHILKRNPKIVPVMKKRKIHHLYRYKSFSTDTRKIGAYMDESSWTSTLIKIEPPLLT